MSTDSIDTTNVKPSYFAKRGQPMCSCWGKSEIEWIALAYVQALVNDGDEWKRLTRERTYELLTDEQRRRTFDFLTDDYQVYKDWFEMVANTIDDADGAFSVGGLGWSKWQYKP